MLQDRLEIKQKSLNWFQNALTQIGRVWIEQGQRKNLSLTKKIQKTLKDIFENKIKYIEKKADLLINALVEVTKRGRLFKKGFKK